ncbi:hypothetical protein [Stecheria intestinalis]|nr:hypothetical protein [Stecheria intestinalis]MDD5880276.1 hypothetical protein [Stecheria intestinalis]
MANIRSAYAEAMNDALEYNGYPIAKNPSYYTDGKTGSMSMGRAMYLQW